MIISAKSPKWADENKRAIDLVIRIEGIEEELPFTASPNDLEEDGKAIFQMALNGEFGQINEYVSPKQVVPQVVSKFQGRAALAQAGLLQKVDSYMQQQPADSLAKIAWDHAQEFKRQSLIVLEIGKTLGMNESQLDELFIAAAKIEA